MLKLDVEASLRARDVPGGTAPKRVARSAGGGATAARRARRKRRERWLSGVKIAPSILSADYLRLGEQVREAEAAGADYIHVDVMDGHFVPNITIGPVVVEAMRRATTLPLDVHLMIEEPERHVEAFAKAGASFLTVHPEATLQLHRTIAIDPAAGRAAGRRAEPGRRPSRWWRTCWRTSTWCWS